MKSIKLRSALVALNAVMASLLMATPAHAASCSPALICGLGGGCPSTAYATAICSALTPSGCQLISAECAYCPEGNGGFYCVWQ